jgi:Holliday junction resolvase-like predicted endonuclease
MATGRSNYLTKQAGEYLVAAELSRRGYIATTFTGNLPYYDIIAVDDSGGHAVVQVKAIASASWQFSATTFADIVMNGRKQIVRRANKEPYPNLICVLVQVARMNSCTSDRFFVLPWRELCRVIVDHHTKYLAKHGGIRPRKPESMHTGLLPSQITSWEGKWDVLKKSVRPVQSELTPR